MINYFVVILLLSLMVTIRSLNNKLLYKNYFGNVSHFDYLEKHHHNFEKIPNFRNKSGAERMGTLHLKSRALVNRLLDHTSIIGPRHNPLDPVTIRIHLQLQQVVKVDVDTQQMVLSAWLYQSWRDDSLSWTRECFKGRFVRLKPTDIWVPDVGFINTAENTQSLKPITILPVRVNWMGVVSWQQPILITTLCRMDVSFFPYDTQTCTLSMMSFRKHGGLINLCHMQDVNGLRLIFEQIHDHPEWNLIHSKKLRQVIKVGGGKKFSSRLQFVFSFQRRAFFYEFSLLSPLYIITFMALFSFTLPNACGEKICYSVTILLSLVINLSLLSQFVPNSSDNFPVVGLFFLVAIVLVGLSVVLNVLTLFIHSCSMDPMPILQLLWRIVVRYMGRLTLMSERSYLNKMHQLTDSSNRDRILHQVASYITILTTSNREDCASTPITPDDPLDHLLSPSVQKVIIAILRTIQSTLCDFLSKSRSMDERRVRSVQWMIVADTLDRLFFILFLLVIIIFATYFRFNVHYRSHVEMMELKEAYDHMEDFSCNYE